MGELRRDIIVIGGSAGALDPLKLIIKELPADLAAAVIVVLHLGASSKTALAPILNRLGGLHAVSPHNGDPIRPGYVYVASADHHLELTDQSFQLTGGPRVNSVRPAIDVLFCSAAETHGSRVAGVVLSGGLDDGSAGLAAIKAAGGVGIVQSPDEALMDSMPRNAIRAAAPDYILPAEQIGEMIKRLVVNGERSRPLQRPEGVELVERSDA